MKKKILIISLFSVIFSFISYKVVDANHKYTYNDVSASTVDVRFKMTLSSSVPYIGGSVAYTSGYRGSGTHIVVMDTGIEPSHPFFGGRVVLEACFSSRCPNDQTQMVGSGAAKPVHWHGTHVAGIAAGSSNAFRGVAPEAGIIAVNVFDIYGGADDIHITKALNWIASISDQYNIVAVNMSLGGNQTFKTTCDGYLPDMTEAVRNLRNKNIATVISSGNSYAYGMSAPACISYAVSVASTAATSDVVSTFSNISELTTFAAPGALINSSTLMGSYKTASGTSMSSPHIAGAFAVYRSKYGIQQVSKVVSDFSNTSKKAHDKFTNLYVNRLDLTALFSDGSAPVVPTTTTTVVTTTTTVPTTSTTVTPPVSTVPKPTPTTVVPPRFYPTLTKPLLYELDGRFSEFTYVKYRVPVRGRNIVSHYNLYCNGPKTYVIPHQSVWSVDTYKLSVTPKDVGMCYMTAVDIYGRESDPSMFVRVYPRSK